LESERLTESDLAELPDEILRFINTKNSEQAWIQNINAHNILERTRRHYFIPIWEENSKRLYTLRDLEWKWQDMFVRNHPEFKVAGIFDDLSECVLCK